MAEDRELALVLKLVADQFQSELKSSQGALAGFNEFIKDWRTQVAAAGTALFALAKSTANFGEEMLKGAQKAGTTVETFSALSHAAKMADLDNQQLILGLKSLSQNMVEAQQKTGGGAAVFQQLGVAAVDSANKLKPTEQVLLELADVFAKSADGAAKADAAVRLFGRAGLDLIPFLNQGKAGIAELMAEAQRLGVTLSKEDAEAANRFNDELKKMETVSRGLSLQLGKELVPVFTQLLGAVKEVGAGPVGKLFKLEIQGWASIFTLLNHAIKETKLELDAFINKLGKTDSIKKFWDDVLRQSRKALDDDTEKKLRGIFNPSTPPSSPSPSRPQLAGGGGAAASVDVGKEQERIGKALLEIFLLQNRALEIKNRLAGEHLALILQEDKAERERQERLEDAAIEEAKGRRIVRDTQEQLRGQEQEQLGRQIIQQTQAQLAITEQLRRESMGFFDHWREGMKKYVQDTQSGFGFAQDMARRTAQVMEQSFRTFFLDLMDGQIKSVKDLFRGLLDFVKQIIAQMVAQLITSKVLQLVGGGFGGGLGGLFGGAASSGFGSGAAANQWFGGFATGGSFVVPGFGGTDSQMVGLRATPGERVTVETPEQQRSGRGNTINITIHAGSGGGARESGQGGGPNLTQLARDIGRMIEAKLVDEQRPGGLLATA